MLPDQNHINQVCEALWRRSGGGASVMVGSGFSRNARSVRPTAKPLPMLDEIAGELFQVLYPDSRPRTRGEIRLHRFRSTGGTGEVMYV